MKNGLGEKIIEEFVGLRAKTYDYLKDNNDEDKKNQKAKKCGSLKGNLDFKVIKTVYKKLKIKII